MIRYLTLLSLFTLILIDQYTKALAMDWLMFQNVTFIPDFVNFALAFNKGVAFSLFANQHEMYIICITIVNFIAIVGLVYWLVANQHPLLINLGLSLIIAGGSSNLIDRIKLHYVIDFIQLSVFDYQLFICNVADIYVTIGAVLFIYSRIVEQS